MINDSSNSNIEMKRGIQELQSRSDNCKVILMTIIIVVIIIVLRYTAVALPLLCDHTEQLNGELSYHPSNNM